MGVLEEVDLRRYEDIQHHLAQSVCIDYVMVRKMKLRNRYQYLNYVSSRWSKHICRYKCH